MTFAMGEIDELIGISNGDLFRDEREVREFFGSAALMNVIFENLGPDQREAQLVPDPDDPDGEPIELELPRWVPTATDISGEIWPIDRAVLAQMGRDVIADRSMMAA